MPQAILLFGPTRAVSEPPDPAAVAEDSVEGMMERCAKLGINTGDCAALMVLDLVARLCAYSRADLPAVLQALAVSVPAREMLLRAANEAGEPAPPLGAAKLAIVTARRLH
jgi:hypothetical protein